MKLEEVIAGFGPYRRALREEDRRAFDALMNRARRYASAAGFQASPDPLETAFLSMLVGLERELSELRRRAERGERAEPALEELVRDVERAEGPGQGAGSGEGPGGPRGESID